VHGLILEPAEVTKPIAANTTGGPASPSPGIRLMKAFLGASA
jgi:hypothetical protein